MCQAYGPSELVGCSKCGKGYYEGSRHVCKTEIPPKRPTPSPEMEAREDDMLTEIDDYYGEVAIGETRGELTAAQERKQKVSAILRRHRAAGPQCPKCGKRVASGINSYGEFFVVCIDADCHSGLERPRSLEDCAKFFGPSPLPGAEELARTWYEMMKSDDPWHFAEHEEDNPHDGPPSIICEYTFDLFRNSPMVKSGLAALASLRSDPKAENRIEGERNG